MSNNNACLVCLGSNEEGEIHLTNARNALSRIFGQVDFGKPIVTKAEGTLVQPDYWNQAASFVTELSNEEVNAVLKRIEKENGRTPQDKLQGRVPLDIDLLVYDRKI